MPGQVDQDVDLVGSYLIRQKIIGPLRGISPPVRGLLKISGDEVLGWRAGVSKHVLSWCFSTGLNAKAAECALKSDDT